MARERLYYVYIMASKSRVIYVGMTGFLMARVLPYRAGEGGAFTLKYRVHRLVYYHGFQNVGDASARETEIKKWRREKKVALIRAENPTWEDLAAGWGEAGDPPVSSPQPTVTSDLAPTAKSIHHCPAQGVERVRPQTHAGKRGT
jgi:putative endonuclease